MEDLNILSGYTKITSYSEAAVVFNQGDIGENFYIILHGSVGVRSDVGDERCRVRGESVGLSIAS